MESASQSESSTPSGSNPDADHETNPRLTSTRHHFPTAKSDPQNVDKEAFDPNLDTNLPYRTLSANARLDEYRLEVPSGSIPGPLKPDTMTKGTSPHGGDTRYKLVTFRPEDPENPKNWSKAYKWYCTMVVAMTCFVVAFASAVITADIVGVSKEFHVSMELALVSVSVFVVGFGVGPMIFAPLSEIYGRRII